MAIKRCVVCGEEFDARASTKTCSLKCSDDRRIHRNAAYRNNNREKLRSKGRRYAAEHREERKEYSKTHRRKSTNQDKAKNRERHRKFRNSNRELYNAIKREQLRKRRENPSNREKYNKYMRDRNVKLRRALKVLETLGVDL